MSAPQNTDSAPGTQPGSGAETDRVTDAPERPKHGPQFRGHGPGAQGPVEKAINFGPSLRRLLGRLRPERGKIVVVFVLTIVAVLANVLGPKVIGEMTNLLFAGLIGKNLPAGVPIERIIAGLRAQGQGTFADMLSGMQVTPGVGVDWGAVGRVGLIALGLAVVGGLFMWASGWLLNDVVQATVYRMRRDVETKLDRLPLAYFDRQPRGELLSRVTNDIDNIAQSLQQTLSQLLTNLLTLVGVLVMMLWVSPILAVIALIAVPISLVAAMLIGRRAQARFAEMWKSTGDLNAQIEEAYTGHALVKVFGRSKEVEASFQRDNDRLYSSSFSAQFISGLMMPVMFFIGNLTYVAVAVVGGLRVATGQMSLGDVQAFIQYSRMFTQPITQVASMANLLQSGVASAERVFQVLDADEQTPDADGVLPSPVLGRVAFEDVSFSYVPEKPLIEHLDLGAEPGATVAIVGPTGAGKTTLVNLLMRFYEVNAGRITLDGVDIASVPRADLRGKLGMVLQDTWLFHGTIADNIRYGRLDATDDELRAAATATYVDRFVRSLPQGYDTVIDEEGSNVSAGEKQLITIARAFLADPSLLVLDEATSSVDTRTELLLQRAMAALRTDRTSFVIAHRLSTIRDADTILVMENGSIVEQGDHDELMAAQGAYYRLYQSQFRAEQAEADPAPAGGHS